MDKLRGISTFWFSLLLYLVLILFLLVASLLTTQGHFGYPIDDTYIHMAIGKHFATEGYWGVSQFGFSSSTSSPLWTFLIAISYMIFGVNDYIPFILSLLTGILIIIYSHSILLTRLDAFRSKIFIASTLIITPLSILTLSGMEHLLHALLNIIFLFSAIEYLNNQQVTWKNTALLSLTALTMTITRYEGLFLVFPLCILLLLQKRLLQSIVIGGSGLLSIGAYGIFSLANGWFFLPNSILLKGNSLKVSSEGLLSFSQRLLNNILLAPHIFILLVVSIGVFFWAKKHQLISNKEKHLTILFAASSFLHLQFASVGWFYRYDAYIILTGILLIAWIAGPLFKNIELLEQGKFLKSTAILLLGIFLIMPLSIRAEVAHFQYPTAIKNIHDQQYQIALFLKKFYSGSVIAANDIGAISYIADVKTLDLYGLANLEVASAKINETYDTNTIRKLVSKNNVEIIVIYDAWFKDNHPPEWIEVGKWKIVNNVVCANDTVTFYVPSKAFSSKAITSLQEFSRYLPKDVEQTGVYTVR